MKLSKLLLSFGTLALAVASAASSYHFSLYQPSFVAGTELKAGDYKLEVAGDKATIKAGKHVVEANVKTETANEKFASTSVRYSTDGGKMMIQEIRLGGTNTKIVFSN
jgi:hypothetical protein